MIDFDTRIDNTDGDILSECALTLEQRVKARQRVTLKNGGTAGLYIQRGSVLHDGDLIQANNGEVICIRAADESVSTVQFEDPLSMAKACYHLGNRHVALQINELMVRYQHDHVLDDMLISMGLKPMHEMAPFEPESGAYGEHGHAKPHSHGGEHNHSHDHSHEH